MTTATRWSTPTEVDDVLIAFPADVEHLLPQEIEIPEEFLKGNSWTRVVDTWFADGLHAQTTFALKDEMTGKGELMLRHIQCCMGSFQPSHQRKIAGVGYLLSLWCDGIRYAAQYRNAGIGQREPNPEPAFNYAGPQDVAEALAEAAHQAQRQSSETSETNATTNTSPETA